MARRRTRVAAVLGVSFALRAPAVAQEPPTADYYVYVAAESEDEVDLIRFGPSGAATVARVPVGLLRTETEGPHGIAIDPEGSSWYVSIAHGLPYGQIHKYGTGTNEPMGRVEVGMFPATMAVSGSGLLFVANFDLHGDPVPGSVSVVETGSMAEIARITTCARPHGSGLSPDGRRHYSVCVLDDQLVEIDTRSLEVTRRLYLEPGAERALPVGAVESAALVGRRPGEGDAARCGPTWVRPSPDGRRVWVACNGNAEVLDVDLESWSVARRIETGPGPYNLDVAPDGSVLAVTYKGARAVGLVDVEAGAERAVVPTTRRLPHGVAISPDARYAFVSVEGVGGEPGAVDVIDLAAEVRVGSAEVGRQAGGVGFWKMETIGRGRSPDE